MLKRRVVKANLCKKGFVVDKVSKSVDHIYLRYVTPDNKKTTIFTKISHGKDGQELSKQLEGEMAKQIYLSKVDFVKFAECSMSKETYFEMIKDKI